MGYKALVRIFCLLGIAASFVTWHSLEASDASIPEGNSFEPQFNRDIRPVLSANCYNCHGPNEAKSGLRLDQQDGIQKAFGEVDLAKNVAWKRLNSTDPDEQMPPRGSHNKLKPDELVKLRQWVVQGAEYQGHWAFTLPTQIATPSLHNSKWIRNPIDAYVLQQLEKRDRSPSPAAGRDQLIRRVTLDLTGLPPTTSEIDAFLADHSPVAFEKVADRLLDSPHFGERMAVPWLDAARYADTNGFSIDDHRDMWLWREWVIDAFNRNMPYDRFVVEQLAGDLLPDSTTQQRLATGFLRNSMNTHEGGTLADEYRVIYIADKIDTVSTVFMGLTMRCAQCHSHKYDPISQEDYYKFFAFFDTAEEPGTGAVNGNTSPTQRMEGLMTDNATWQKDIKDRIATLKRYQLHPPELIKERVAWERATCESADGDLLAALTTSFDLRSEDHWKTINTAFSKTSELFRRHILTINREIKVLENELKADQPSVMVMKEQGARQTYLLTRGQYDQPDKTRPVSPGVPAILPPLDEKPQPYDSSRPSRLTLARWLTRPDHPLTARVAVNRFWQILFGRGLVSTPNDFGSQGAFPTHPELLDWLALEYSQNGWDTKRLIKTIVMSSTYQQSSFAPRSLIESDPQNELLGRAPRFRLPAEFIRDGALAISGTLGPRVGGPSVYPHEPDGLWREISHFGYPDAFTAQALYPSDAPGQYRRSMYTFWKRTSPPPSMIAFDAPSREVCTVDRSRTNTPLQALVLLNDPEYVSAARSLAELAISEGGKTNDDRLNFIYRRATSRLPEQDERRILIRRFGDALKSYQKDTNSTKSLAGNGSNAELAAWTVVASVVLNLDEVITRE